ncbi:hypothetical protein, partial [Deinococcus radiotolerans]|uniref:hypothetical protein n=1 Tax=Deinococcus radiotolerans TaxID=1309407 RepID=UPI001E2CAFC5
MTQPWRARKVRDLLALLLCASVGTDRPGRTRDDLTARLWPDLPEAAATTTFRKTLLRLRAALGNAAQVDHGPDGYVLRGLHADLIHFLNALDQRDLVAACAWYEADYPSKRTVGSRKSAPVRYFCD